MIVNGYTGTANVPTGTCSFTHTETQQTQTIPIYPGDGALLIDYAVFPTAGDVRQLNAQTAEYVTYTDLEGGRVIWRHVRDGDRFEDVPW